MTEALPFTYASQKTDMFRDEDRANKTANNPGHQRLTYSRLKRWFETKIRPLRFENAAPGEAFFSVIKCHPWFVYHLLALDIGRFGQHVLNFPFSYMQIELHSELSHRRFSF